MSSQLWDLFASRGEHGALSTGCSPVVYCEHLPIVFAGIRLNSG